MKLQHLSALVVLAKVAVTLPFLEKRVSLFPFDYYIGALF